MKKIAIAFKESRRVWFRDLLVQLGVADADGLATQLTLLVDGAIAQDLVRDDPSMARAAKEAARVLLANAGIRPDSGSAAGNPSTRPEDPTRQTMKTINPCERGIHAADVTTHRPTAAAAPSRARTRRAPRPAALAPRPPRAAARAAPPPPPRARPLTSVGKIAANRKVLRLNAMRLTIRYHQTVDPIRHLLTRALSSRPAALFSTYNERKVLNPRRRCPHDRRIAICRWSTSRNVF